ncbi:hypothetical protein FCULG_00000532 [Fusarium culmorum]|uniref:Uncharacterized protein n=1 Tax=Fusarium culmorum TaxID=5516 RepID=A0A2T4GJ03_FUSCU|nr:hypothetical protein FCULG_00000532 [Fusarium culmorum]
MSEITPSAMRQECLDNETIEADDIRVRDPLVPSVGVFDSDSFSEFIIINVPSVWGVTVRLSACQTDSVRVSVLHSGFSSGTAKIHTIQGCIFGYVFRSKLPNMNMNQPNSE